MQEGPGNEQNSAPAWDPNSGLPPPMTTEYGYGETLSAPQPPLSWDPSSGMPPPMTDKYGYTETPLTHPPLPPEAFSDTVIEVRDAIDAQTEGLQGPIADGLKQLHESLVKGEVENGEKTDEAKIQMETNKLRDFMESQELLKSLIQEEGERLLTKDEREKLLSPEVLATLSTEEYIKLWKHLNSHYVSHVTRQGYRENYFSSHSKGLGEFHNNFVALLQDGKGLKSPVALQGILSDDDRREQFVDILEEIDFTSLESVDPWGTGGPERHPNPWARIKLRLTARLASAPRVPDETAMHLAADEVSDGLYGGETGNQIFAVYPSDMIASQYNFAFNRNDLSFTDKLPQGEEKWNDVFVWNKDDPMKSEVSIDAGIVFLPKTTPVDPKTGSKYASYKSIITDSGERVFESELPSEPMTSEEYWSTYFAAHPELKPKHIIFYEGNPTAAVRAFMEENAITTRNAGTDDGGKSLGFEENQIANMSDDSRMQRVERNAFRAGALALVDYFDRHPGISPDELMTASDLEEIKALVSSRE